MPNHVLNVWKVYNIPYDKTQYILNKIARRTDDTNWIIDFDLIIPQPRFKKDCPKQYRIESAKSAHIEEDDHRPWFNWLNWNVDNWGTKWEAYDGYTLVEGHTVTFVFNTAWCFAEPVARKLEQLGYDLELSYADECIGTNCGKYSYNAHTKKWQIQDVSSLPDPEAFATDIWNNY